MSRLIVKNIKGLAGAYAKSPSRLRGQEMNGLPVLENAFVTVVGSRISGFGDMKDYSVGDEAGAEVIDAAGRFVLPSWCDSHTHLVFAATRELEFEDRIKGMSYEDIAARGGGILNSARRMADMDEDSLFEAAMERLDRLARMGTGAIEVKSGYGLSTETELKMLRVVKRLRESSDVAIRSTLLGAHAVPDSHKGDRPGYVKTVIDEMIPAAAEQGLADYVDAFCEKGYFNAEETLAIVAKGAEYGMKAKIHVNQFNALGALPKLVEAGVLSVDHLEVLAAGEARVLGNSDTVATALPLCSLFLSLPYTPTVELMEANAVVALATDYNPGSAPSGNMNLVVSLACIKMGMTPEAAINAATLNGAAAMERADTHGSIMPGKVANLLITEPCEHLSYLPYSFGRPVLETVILNGKVLK